MLSFIGIFSLLIILSECSNTSSKTYINKRNLDFNLDWKFYEGDINGAENAAFDDSGWREVDLPHDWAIEDHVIQDSVRMGPFQKDLEMGDDVGYLRGGTAWYRKTFIQKKNEADNLVFLHFDGVQTEMKLWVNGGYVGTHVYGYTPFYFEITPWLMEAGQPNVIAVQVINPGKNSRWYTGSGIYRQVHLSQLNPLFLDVWGTYIRTVQLDDSKADIKIDLKYNSKLNEESGFILSTEILSPSGEVVAQLEEDLNAAPLESGMVEISVVVHHPELWSPESPVLYHAWFRIIQEGRTVDEVHTPFGIRTIQYDAEQGFLLNGAPVLMKGACMHHDNGILGTATYERAEERRVEIMKNNGYNAIRTSHNPPSEAFLDACDRLGMLVIDESFDMWVLPKRPNDYHVHYKDWWKMDLETMLLRDRNHPSVIMWSFGNEVKERADSLGIKLAEEMIDHIKTFDVSRPITQAICAFWDNPSKEWDDSAPAFELLDIGGYNYQWRQYESDHRKYPERMMFGSESFPMEAFENWQLVEKYPYVIGDFVWTGMDYIGESGIGHAEYTDDPQRRGTFLMPWPWYVSWCGDIDITGQKKPQSYYRDVVWGESNLEILVHEPVPEGFRESVSMWGWPLEKNHWNWEVDPGTPLQVHVYTSYPSVKVELNGREIGMKNVSSSSKLTATFEVPYEEGELRAIGISDNNEMESKSLKTTGRVIGLRLAPERSVIGAGRGEVAYIHLMAVDQEEQLVPLADIPVTITVEGEGELIAAGNASPEHQGSLQDEACSLFRGRALLVIRSSGNPGRITVKADGFEEGISATTTIVAE